MILFLAGVMLLLFSSLLAPFSRNGSTWADRFSLVSGFAGCVLGLYAAASCLLSRETYSLAVPWLSTMGLFSLRLDELGAVFLIPAFFITGTGLLYGTGYLPHAESPRSSAWVRFFYPLLAAGIALVLTANNGMVFLISWELMALSGYFLVITEREDDQNRQAGLIYLISTHVGTLALFALFALLGENVCLQTLPAAGSLTSSLTTDTVLLFFLALVGFGIKSGIMPLHIWLPGAHAAAPSHVSALMSGVMIKTGIYGLLRFLSFFQTPPAWWGWAFLGLGLFSGIFGVVFAIAQHDIKRLLAYHSIENIGIILLGIGAAVLGKTYGMETMVVLGLAGALLHVVNHGLFKGLLFLSAGSVIRATGTKRLTSYGGLLRTMPYTGLFFLGGAVAICGLPPLNGFVSEWLVYLALLQPGIGGPASLSAILLGVPGLAMIGGLALLCFAKVFGLSFLGTARTPQLQADEAPGSMLWAMGLLLAACLWIGLAPSSILPLLSPVPSVWDGISNSASPAQPLDAAALISLCALILLVLLVFLFLLNRRCRTLHTEQPPTWDCGFAGTIERAQYTTSSFAEMVMQFFGWILKTRFEGRKTQSIFPAPRDFVSHTADLVLDRLLLPGCSRLAGLAVTIRHSLHQGIIGIYLLYTALALCLLLAASIFLK